MTHSKAELERLMEMAPQAAEFLRQMSNANRFMILCHISDEERSVGQLEADLGIKQPALSQQLAELRQYGLVKTRRQSRSIYYSIADERVLSLIEVMHGIFCGGGRDALRPVQLEPTRGSHCAGDAAQFPQITRSGR